MSEHDRQGVLLQGLGARPVAVGFDEPTATSNGGAVLLGIVDRRLGLSSALAAAIQDGRQAGKVRHEVADLLRQRVHGLACGYSDCNDTARIGADPALRLLMDLDDGESPASQPTLSQFETSRTPDEVVHLMDALADAVLRRHARRLKRRVRRITLDLDVTDDLTHGSQQLALFNTHYGGWCYLPLLAFVSFDDEPEQYLIGTVLREGRSPSSGEIVELLEYLVSCVRKHFPKTEILVRTDAGFTSGEVLAWLEEQRLSYLLGMPKNPRLNERSEALLAKARRESERTGRTVALFDETGYCAKSWRGTSRRVVFKAEVTRLDGREPRENPRYVVTNLKRRPRRIYDLYCMRGDVENRIKELKSDLDLGRTSCASANANHVRMLLTSAAYALMQELRLHVGRVLRQRPSVASMRQRLIKIGGCVITSVRRVVFRLATSHPWKDDWLRVASALGASSA